MVLDRFLLPQEALVILQTDKNPTAAGSPSSKKADGGPETQEAGEENNVEALKTLLDRLRKESDEEKHKLKQVIKDQEVIIQRLQDQISLSTADNNGMQGVTDDGALLRLQNSLLKNRLVEIEQKLMRLQEEHDSLLGKQVSGYRQNQVQNIMSAAIANSQLMALRAQLER